MPNPIRRILEYLEYQYENAQITHEEYSELRRAAYEEELCRKRKDTVQVKKRNALLMQELIHQQRMGVVIAEMERKGKMPTILPLHTGMHIVLQKNIPAEVLEQNSQHVVLRIAGMKYRLHRNWVVGKFTYGRTYA